MTPSLHSSPLNRRQFLRATTASVAAVSLVPRHVLGGAKFVPPSEQVNIALIGAGGQGRTNARALFNETDARIVAICDPIERHDLTPFYYKGLAGRLPVKAEIEKHHRQQTPNFRCAEYEDFRRLLETEKHLDAILCATPDHAHASVIVPAMRLGKHVYCEKPLTHNVWEARHVAKVARETGVATQMGNQGHSGEGIRSTVEWVRDGAIGPVREVHAWSGAGRWGKGLSGRPQDEAVPAGVNWDLWIGPRQPRPYSGYYTPVTWRDYWAFGTAPIGDMACHNFDPAFWALELDRPFSIEATCAGDLDQEMAPYGTIYTYHYGPRGNLPPVKFMWYDGGLQPPKPVELEEGYDLGAGGNGVLFIGDQGALTCPGWGGNPRLIPDAKSDTYKRPAKTLPRSKGHHRDWLDACKGGPPASANFEYGAKLTEIVLLGPVALRARKRLQWDAAHMQATNAPEADPFLKETYRQGWEVA